MKKINVAVVDDQTLFRENLVEIFQSSPGLNVTISANNGSDFLLQLENATELPEIALVDMAMPEINGIELTPILREKYPSIKIIILSVYDQERYVYKMINSGASGYLIKTCTKAEVLEAIRSVHVTDFYVSKQTISALKNAGKYQNRQIKTINNIEIDLTVREKEILTLICKEYSNAEIGEKLFLSIRTVEGHRNNLLLKTGSHNTAGLIVFALRNQLFEIAPL